MLVVALLLSSGTIKEISIPKETIKHQGKLRLAGNTYYVSPSGSDAGSGGLDQPFATIQKAAGVAQAGSVVLVEDGEYQLSSTLLLKASGTSSSPITFKAEHSRQAVIDGPVTGVVKNDLGVKISGSFVVFDGFVVRNSGASNIKTQGTDIILNDLEVYGAGVECMTQHCGEGISPSRADDGSTDSQRLKITNSDIHGNFEHGIYVDNAASYVQVVGNWIHDNSNPAYNPSGNFDFQVNCQDGLPAGTPGSTNLLIANNVISTSRTNYPEDAMNLMCMQDSLVENNLINEPGKGISLGQSDAYHGSSNNLFTYNTVVVGGYGAFLITGSSLVTGNSAFNNILVETNANNAPIILDSTTSPLPAGMDYNVVWNTKKPSYLIEQSNANLPYSQWNALGFDNHSKPLDPQFVAGDNHYHISSNSPAIGAATSQYPLPASDLDGNARPQDGRYDIGAYEYQSGYNPTTTTTTSTLTPTTLAGTTTTASQGTTTTTGSNVTTTTTPSSNGITTTTPANGEATTTSPSSTTTLSQGTNLNSSQIFQTTTLPPYEWESTTTTLPSGHNLAGIDRIKSLIDDLWNWILSFLKLIKAK